MFIPDLHEFPSGHPPVPEGTLFITRGTLAGRAALPDGVVLRAIGWLGETIPRVGDTPAACIARLFDAHERGFVIKDHSRGWHSCEVCQRLSADTHLYHKVEWGDRTLQLYGHGHFIVLAKRRLFRRRVAYMYPALLLHYVLVHQYRPPDEFVTAVLCGHFLSDDNLALADPEPLL
jgi:hypothetical protein